MKPLKLVSTNKEGVSIEPAGRLKIRNNGFTVATSSEFEQTQLALARAQLEDIPVNALDRKTIIIWTIVTAIIAVASFLIGASRC